MRERDGLFITGTDTGVGKTWTTLSLLRQLRERRVSAVGMKPVECGGREDSRALSEAAGAKFDLDLINPYPLPEPLAPAAMRGEEGAVEIETVLHTFSRLRKATDVVLVEGAGGWLVPLDGERTMADLAMALALPVLIVAANRLGVLNHTLLTVRAIQQTGLECRAIFLNTIPSDGDDKDLSRQSNARVLRQILHPIPVIDGELGELVQTVFPEVTDL